MSETEPPPTGPESEWQPAWDPDTGSQPANSRRRRHRAPFAANQQVGRLLAPLGAVAVVVVVVLLLIWINGHAPGGTSSAGVVATPPTSPTIVVPKHTHHSSPSSTPSSNAPISRSPSAKASPSVKPSKSKHARPAKLTAMAPVQVLNNSRFHGLAHEVAAQIAARGWRIATIGNLQGLIPETTVYFAPGEEPAAEHLAQEFPSIRRIEPNSAAGLTATGITLVLTRDWVS